LQNARLIGLYICGTTHFTYYGCSLGVHALGFVIIQVFSFHVWPFAFMLPVTWIKNYCS